MTPQIINMSGSNICKKTTTTHNNNKKTNNNIKQSSPSSKTKQYEVVKKNKNSDNSNKSGKQFSFIKRLNPFGSSSSSHTCNSVLKGKIDDVISNRQYSVSSHDLRNIRASYQQNDVDYGDVKTLKQFWNNHILSTQKSSNISLVKKKSATLSGHYRSLDESHYQKDDDEDLVVLERQHRKRCISENLSASSVSTLNYKADEKNRILRDDSRENTVVLKSHTNIDNFDKYKSAETVKSRRVSREETNVIIVRPTGFPSNFPLIAATTGGTKIHWAKRDDIFGKSRQRKNSYNDDMLIQSEVSGQENSPDKVKNYDEFHVKKGNDIMVSDMVDMVMTDNSKAKLTPKTSTDSSSHGNKPTRKISFRMQKNVTPTNSYNRRLKHENSSRVAALTLRFNQMIQQDSSLLNELKKNGGIVHKSGGHVYKIVEEDLAKIKNDDASSVSSKQSRKKVSVRRKASMKSVGSKQNGRQKSVQETIQLFEPLKSTGLKPKVPDKSDTVKQRSEELKRLQKQIISTTPEIILQEANEAFVTSEILIMDKPIPDFNLNKELESMEQFNNEESSVTSIHQHYLKKESDHRSKYSRMYEKLKFRSLFSSTKKLNTVDSNETIEESSPEQIQDAITTIQTSSTLSAPCIQMHLKNETDAIEIDNEPSSPDYKPNTSFLFRNATLPKNSFHSTNDIQSSLVEAINEALINKTRSMDENTFPHDSLEFFPVKNKSSLHEDNRLLSTIKVAENSTEAINEMCDRKEDDYEYIKKPSGDQELSKEEVDARKSTESIYQTLTEVYESNKVNLKAQSHDKIKNRDSINSYESFEESYETLDEYQKTTTKASVVLEDGYESCDPPEPPPPRKPIATPINIELTLPAPKRIIHSVSENYEHIRIPSRPSMDKQQEQLPLPPRSVILEEDSPENDYYEENIYDTIKNSDNRSLLSSCYEAMQERSKLTGEPNCLLYDTVKTDFHRNFAQYLQHAESTLTLASDHKTNSIYGTTIGQSITPPSERGSDNSDEWIDISDDEEGHKQKFVV